MAASGPGTPLAATPARVVAVRMLRTPSAPRRYMRLAARSIVGLALALAVLVLALIVLYRWVNPPLSALMLGQWLSGERVTQRWVPLERISPHLRLATIMSEDGKFCRHRGVDWAELSEAIESARDGVARGGSTITMQVVKNLFLWPSRSYVRKAIEIPLTYVVEAAWPKRRILEVYLNIAEWGPGVFGAEAAARFHFRKTAAQLSPQEAALLAVSLPNPFEREAGSPGPGTLRLAGNLLARMRTAQANAFCVLGR
jgi:monofunctional biosynthetic peptidoglycan transglycosylase